MAANACNQCGCAYSECECARTDCLLRTAETLVSQELGFPVELGERKYSARIILKYLQLTKK